MSDIKTPLKFETILADKLQNLKDENLYRQPKKLDKTDSLNFTKDGKQLISFSCNDYFALSNSNEPTSINGSGSARLVNGTGEIYSKLEASIAKLTNSQAALVFGSGYLANIGVISSLIGRKALVLSDRLCHACILDGIKLSGADHKRFKHNDLVDLKRQLKANKGKQKFVITETIFSMDGDKAPLNEIYELCQEYDAILITDDAHGLYEKPYKSDVKIGTLSKAVGGYGGYVAASQVYIDYITNSARSFIFSTSLPEGVIKHNLSNIEKIIDNKFASQAIDNAQLFCSILGIEKPQSAIVPIIVGDIAKAQEIANKLEEQGYLVSVIRPPTVPKGTTRLRFTFSSGHKPADVEKLAKLVKDYAHA